MQNIRSLVISFLIVFVSLPSYSYDSRDSVRITSFLSAASLLRNDVNKILFFARQFEGIPYVAHTLDKDTEEHMVINTRELDCTTFVENVVALTLCSNNGASTFEDYVNMLKNIRYRNGDISYCNRLHYFTDWIEDNEKMGFVRKVEKDGHPFTATQKLNINYMSEHYESYSMLKMHKEWLPCIKDTEKRLTGKTYKYIPKNAIRNTTLLRNTIHDGDIIAILTNKKGLDTSHIGIAVWHKDGLHLFNASQIHKKVIEEPMLFFNYMQKHPSQTGIRVCRVV